MIHFSLTDHIYAAPYDESIIILDSAQDNYISLMGDAAHYLRKILATSFERDGQGKFVPKSATVGDVSEDEHYNQWITDFSQKNFITQCDGTRQKLIAPSPLKPGGLKEYQWDHKPSWKPFAQASKYEVLKALVMLVRVHRMMKRRGIGGILDAIKKASTQHPQRRQPNDQEIQALARTVDAASLLYPKKTFCLAWAATFVLLALRKNFMCQLVIGIQTSPFYAHAWAESAGNVVHDDPVIAQVLSLILKEPHS